MYKIHNKFITKQTDFESVHFSKEEKQILYEMNGLFARIKEAFISDWGILNDYELIQYKQQLKNELKLELKYSLVLLCCKMLFHQ